MKSSKASTNKKTSTSKPPVTAATSNCYCNEKRELGTMELICAICSRWFHGKCLKDLAGFNGVSFMICYVFNCKDCSPTKKETWQPKQANFSHMCVTVLANLSAKRLLEENKLTLDYVSEEPVYFNLQDSIIPYIEENWDLLTSMPKRVKNTWHQTLQKMLIKEKELFKQNPTNENQFSLMDMNLANLGPVNEVVKQIGKKTNFDKTNSATNNIIDKGEDSGTDGPKTRGASKRRCAENSTTSKKPKLATDYSSTAISGSQIDFPFNKDGYRYFLAEKDPNVPERLNETSSTFVIPSMLYRVVMPPTVGISTNDRAYQLQLENTTTSSCNVTGHEGYAMARATHAVSTGTWYFEVNFLEQPRDSHIRIGWSQAYGALQACVGYSKFSYGWRSKHGTKFHEAIGKKYYPGGFKQGDVLGCLIHLPEQPFNSPLNSLETLPETHKDAPLINFKHNYFFEENDEPAEKAKLLKPQSGSKIEFFHNGKSCGVAFEDINAGFYFPAVSLFHKAKISVNFGPKFQKLPAGAKGIGLRGDEHQVEQTISDIIYLVEHQQQTQQTM